MSQHPINIPVINTSHNELPHYATDLSAGMDLRAAISEPVTLGSLERTLIPTGLRVALPEGYEMQIRPRSGLALKHGLSLVNTPGTIDADYRGEIGVIVINLSRDEFTINPGERIAQAVVTRHERVQWQPVDNLDDTDRGDGGFGHSGVK